MPKNISKYIPSKQTNKNPSKNKEYLQTLHTHELNEVKETKFRVRSKLRTWGWQIFNTTNKDLLSVFKTKA